MKRRRRIAMWLVVWIASLFWVLPGAGLPESAQAETHKVTIKKFAFRPAKLTIQAGDTVEFANKARSRHTATYDGEEGFDTGVLKPGESRKIEFRRPAIFKFHCEIHSYMKGEIVVE